MHIVLWDASREEQQNTAENNQRDKALDKRSSHPRPPEVSFRGREKKQRREDTVEDEQYADEDERKQPLRWTRQTRRQRPGD